MADAAHAAIALTVLASGNIHVRIEGAPMPLDLFSLEGKTALVTGGTHGIGMAIGVGLAKAGARLCVNDISGDKLESCREEYRRRGVDVFTLDFDVTSEADVDRGIASIEKEVAPVDILVNNAGIIKRVPMLYGRMCGKM
jgi:gluconate 5-dehydrogenase